MTPAAVPDPGHLRVKSPEVVWRSLAVLFFAGASVGALSLLLPHPASYDEPGLWSNVALAYLIVPPLWFAHRLMPLAWVQFFVLAGICVITRAIFLSGDPGSFYMLWYVWVGLYEFFFFGRAWGLVQLGAVGGAYGWVLLVLPDDLGPARWMMTLATVAVGGLMVDYLARHLQGLAARFATLARDRATLMVTLDQMARTDDLTGLPNRRAWNEELAREVTRARREQTPLSVAMIDLDRFKEFNDRFGHQAGDRFLKSVASAWRECLRTTDSLARYGGEEFALMLPGCDIDDASKLVDRLRATVPDEQTCSAGIAVMAPGEDPAQLLARADALLYQAKESGRDRIVTAT